MRPTLAASLAGLLLLLLLVPGQSSGRMTATVQMTVDAKANIFGAGQSALPAAGGGAGVAPPSYSFTAQTGRTLTFTSVTGKVTCCGELTSPPYHGPAGGTTLGSTDIPPVRGISGVGADRTMFVVGVFLGPGTPTSKPPPTNTMTRSPKLRQVFYVGDGRGGPINVPAKATRLYLGFADAYGFRGPAGWYDDNR